MDCPLQVSLQGSEYRSVYAHGQASQALAFLETPRPGPDLAKVSSCPLTASELLLPAGCYQHVGVGTSVVLAFARTAARGIGHYFSGRCAFLALVNVHCSEGRHSAAAAGTVLTVVAVVESQPGHNRFAHFAAGDAAVAAAGKYSVDPPAAGRNHNRSLHDRRNRHLGIDPPPHAHIRSLRNHSARTRCARALVGHRRSPDHRLAEGIAAVAAALVCRSGVPAADTPRTDCTPLCLKCPLSWYCRASPPRCSLVGLSCRAWLQWKAGFKGREA